MAELYSHEYVVHQIFSFQVKLCFPEEGLVYDYRLDDAGITNVEDNKEDERQVNNYV